MQLYKDLPDEYTSQKPVFISHHPVIEADSITTKISVVFNASGKTSNNTSLNDHTYTGPALQADLPTILQNWRSYKYIFTVDLNEMYRQIFVNLKDVWSQCILWRDGPLLPIKKYCLFTVTYGTRPALFLALRELIQLCDDEGIYFSLALLILLYERFVDEIMSGIYE